MAIHSPPKYRYSLFDPWDREAFELIKQLAAVKNYPKILGSKDEKNRFLVMLIRTQKSLHDWRDFLKDTLEQVKSSGTIDAKTLLQKYPPESVGRDVPAWVTYEEDRIVSDFIDELATKKIEFEGSDEEMGEWCLRFILGQLGHDWEQTVMMIWEMLGEGNKLSLRELNQEMKNFDYLNLFKHG